MAPQSEIEKYRNKRYVRSVRVSDDGEKQDSDAAQLEFLKNWADEREMIHVVDFVEPNLSGSLPGNRTDIQAILHRADTLGDFRYVLSQRIDRATRGGSDHLSWFSHELKRRGVQLLTPGDYLPVDVPFEGTLRAAKADAAQETAMSTSQRSAQGSGAALTARRVSPHSHTPYATHRLYCRPDQTPLFVIADKRNGQQEKRSWPDLKRIDTYGDLGGGSVGHYRKQKSELVYLVPGDPKEQETVRMMMRWRYLDGLSTKKISEMLNASGTPAPRGGKWAAGQVASLVENEDYTGRGIANRRSGALYTRRSSKGPIKVVRDPKLIATAARIPPEVLPKENWFEGEEPYLRDFLGDDTLRDVAISRQTQLWERRLDPTWTRKNAKKHHVGGYLLHPLLRDNVEHESLVGSISGRADAIKRIYRHKKAARESLAGTMWGRTLDAVSLESAVLAVLRDILLDWPELEARLKHHVEQQLALGGDADQRLIDKREQRQDVVDQLLLYVRTLTKKTRDDLAPEIARLEAQRDTLDAEIDMLTKQANIAHIDPTAIASELRQRIEALATEIDDLPQHALAGVLAQLTERLEVDMATKQVEFAFHFPTWMLRSDAKTPLSALCAQTSSRFSTGFHTHRDPALFIPIGDGVCQYQKLHRGVACNCKRRRAA